MGDWNVLSPDGSKSVKANEAIIQKNTTYTKKTLNIDHFWDGDGTEDGHHQFAQMPKFESGGIPANPTIAGGAEGVFYAKEKTAAEAPGGVDVQPFFENTVAAVDQIMQLLAVRAMAVINVSAAGVLSSIYLHNCTVAHKHDGAGVSLGRFTMTFDVALPTANYMFYGGGIVRDSNTSNVLLCNINGGTNDSLPQKTVSRVLIKTQVLSGSSGTKTILDPLQAYFVVFGG